MAQPSGGLCLCLLTRSSPPVLSGRTGLVDASQRADTVVSLAVDSIQSNMAIRESPGHRGLSKSQAPQQRLHGLQDSPPVTPRADTCVNNPHWSFPGLDPSQHPRDGGAVTYATPWGSGAAVAQSLGLLVRPQPPAASPVPSSAPGSCLLSQKQTDSCSHKGDVWRSCCGSHGKLRPLMFLITPGVLFFLV